MISEIQKEMLVLLKRFHAVCIKYGINYSVHAGTMIGIVREHGFIPWDDDADISFTRENFSRFAGLMQNQDVNDLLDAQEGEFFYFSMYDNAFPQLWMARRDKPPVWLDFFIYDYISEKKNVQNWKLFRIALILGLLKNKKTMAATLKRGEYSGFKYALIYGVYLMGKLFPIKQKYRIAEKVRLSSPGKRAYIHRSNDRFIGIGFVYPKEVMEDYQLMPFEDTELMITTRYEDILIPSYGDYMHPVRDNTDQSDVHSLAREMLPFVPPFPISGEEQSAGNRVKVLVAAHKSYRMPEDPMYLPVFVGSALHPELQNAENSGSTTGDETPDITTYQRDDEGGNISTKNPLYCELTALYWGWKNLNADYLGLVHYRRHFVSGRHGNIWDQILTSAEVEEYIRKGVRVLLPRKRYYIIETLYSHYEHSHHAEDLIVTGDVIHSFYPDYADAYVQVMKRRSAHMFNMCIMERSLMDAYCEWLFDVLHLVEERLDISHYSDFDKRVFGRISELLLDVWITRHQIRYTEVPVRNTEGEQFLSKVWKVIRRKFLKKH